MDSVWEIGLKFCAAVSSDQFQRVTVSLIRRLVHAECNCALWNVIIAQRYAYFWKALMALFLEGMFTPFCQPALARSCVTRACQQCSTWCCRSKGHWLSLSLAVRRSEWLLWLHGGITKTLDGFCRSVEHSLVHALVCCRLCRVQ